CSILRYSSFFFSGYVDHRYLHSFPTRRSSDLRRWRAAPDQHHQCQHGRSDRGAGGPPTPAQRARLATTGRTAGGSGGWNRPAFGDRKSTRLNSSHVKISYAVFCLKKKKKKKKK